MKLEVDETCMYTNMVDKAFPISEIKLVFKYGQISLSDHGLHVHSQWGRKHGGSRGLSPPNFGVGGA